MRREPDMAQLSTTSLPAHVLADLEHNEFHRRGHGHTDLADHLSGIDHAAAGCWCRRT